MVPSPGCDVVVAVHPPVCLREAQLRKACRALLGQVGSVTWDVGAVIVPAVVPIPPRIISLGAPPIEAVIIRPISPEP